MSKNPLLFRGMKGFHFEFFGYMLYAISLDISLWFIAPIYSYEGCGYLFDPWKTVFSYCLVASLIYLNHRYLADKISGLFCLVIFSLLILPAIVFFMRSEYPFSHAILVALGYAWLLLSGNFLKRIPLAVKIRVNPYLFWGIIAIVSLSNYALLLYYFGIKFSLDFSLVYEIRNQFIQKKIFLLGYLVVWQGNIINPLLFYWTIQKRRYHLAVLVLLLQTYLFSVTGIKLFAFSIFFAYLIARFADHLKLALPIALMAGLGISQGMYWAEGNVWLLSLFVRRTLFTPGQLTFEYFDFFSKHPFVYLSDSVLKKFLSYPYALSPPFLIGIRYYDGESANVGVIGNAYMQFGIVGIFLFLAFLSILLFLFDRMASWHPENKTLFFVLVATPIISLMNSGFFTVLMTHGLFLSFLLAVSLGLRTSDPKILGNSG